VLAAPSWSSLTYFIVEPYGLTLEPEIVTRWVKRSCLRNVTA
jgi:hypothetical protein